MQNFTVYFKATLSFFSFISASYSTLGFTSIKNLKDKKIFLKKFDLCFYFSNTDFFLTRYIKEKKKGINGILYLTKAPKLVPAMPTPKAKNKEKTKQ